MLEVAGVVGALVAIFLVVGFPAATLVRSRADGIPVLLVDAALFGAILTTLGVTMWAWLGVAGAILAVAVEIAIVVLAVRRRPGIPRLRRPDRATLVFGVGWTVLLLVAFVFRAHNANFIMYTGDMGAYVNWANEFVRAGEFKASWPPLFPAFLSIATALFGAAYTTAGVAATGMLLIVGAARLMHMLRVQRGIIFALSALLAASVHAIWYSSFPASESLNAPFFVAWLVSIVGVWRAERDRLLGWSILNFLAILALGLLRGTGPALLVPILVLGILALSVRAWYSWARRVWLVLALGLVASLICYWYGIARIPRYFITQQITELVPGVIVRFMRSAGLFDPTPLTAVLIVLVVAAMLLPAALILRRRGAVSARALEEPLDDGVDEGRAPRILFRVLAGMLIVGTIATIVVPAEVWLILWRMGAWLVVVGFAALLLPRVTRQAGDRVLMLLVLGMTVGMFIAMHAIRLKVARGHSFFLYWDRYLVSEVLPALLVMCAIGLSIAWVRWGAPRFAAWRDAAADAPRARWREWAPAALATLLVAAVIVPTIPSLVLVSKHTYMEGNFAFEKELVALVPSATTPVYWSATTPERAGDFFFPNTWMAFAVPLKRSFGYNVINASQGRYNFAPDEVATGDELAGFAACDPDRTVVVLETDTGGAPLDLRLAAEQSPSYTLARIGTATSDISLLAQPPIKGDWHRAQITVDAWRYTSTTSDAVACLPTR